MIWFYPIFKCKEHYFNYTISAILPRPTSPPSSCLSTISGVPERAAICKAIEDANRKRVVHHSPPMAPDIKLCRNAQQYAELLARRNSGLQHDFDLLNRLKESLKIVDSFATNFSSKFHFFVQIWIFGQNLDFFVKIWIFGQNSDFSTKFEFLVKIRIFRQILDFWLKFKFLVKIWIFGQNLDYWSKFGLLVKIWIFG